MLRQKFSRVGDSAKAKTPKIIAAMARANTRAMREVMVGAKEEMRDDVLAAGLGFGLAQSVRGVAYPERGRDSMSPAAVVYATRGKAGSRSAAAILGQYERGQRITPALGQGLAIPTDAVPKRRRGVPMSPVEVEAFYNQELFARRLKSGNTGLFLNLVVAKSGKVPRRATPGRLAQGRTPKAILMFTLVKDVPGRKRLDFGGIVRRWGDRFGELAAVNFKEDI